MVDKKGKRHKEKENYSTFIFEGTCKIEWQGSRNIVAMIFWMESKASCFTTEASGKIYTEWNLMYGKKGISENAKFLKKWHKQEMQTISPCWVGNIYIKEEFGQTKSFSNLKLKK